MQKCDTYDMKTCNARVWSVRFKFLFFWGGDCLYWWSFYM